MSQITREQLSNLMDSELRPGELNSVLNDWEQDPEMRAAWARYHLIGDVLRGEAVDRRVFTIADRVRERLAHEPLPQIARPVRRWHRALWEMALAASLAAVAILAGSSLFRGDLSGYHSDFIASTSVATTYQNPIGIRWGQSHPALESRLTAFLVNHQTTAPIVGIKGMVPYATLVHYESGH